MTPVEFLREQTWEDWKQFKGEIIPSCCVSTVSKPQTPRMLYKMHIIVIIFKEITEKRNMVSHLLFRTKGLSFWSLSIQMQISSFFFLFLLVFFVFPSSMYKSLIKSNTLHGLQPNETSKTNRFKEKGGRKENEIFIPRSENVNSRGSVMLLLGSPVAPLSSWQQQPGCGCACAWCMLGDYMH